MNFVYILLIMRENSSVLKQSFATLCNQQMDSLVH